MEKGNKFFHKLDRWVGIPVVLLLGLLRKKKSEFPDDIKTIAILNTSSIGDSILMTGCLHDLVTKYSDVKIILFSGASNYAVAKMIKIPKIDVRKLEVGNPYKAIKRLNTIERVDILFDFAPPWARINAIFSFFVPASFKIGFKSEGQYRHYVYDKVVEHSSNKHELENYRILISDFISSDHQPPSIHLEYTSNVNELVRSFNKYCIIHPWPGGVNSFMKEWSIENWCSLIKKIYNDFDTIIITGGNTDREKNLGLIQVASRFLEDSSKIVNGAGVYTLNETAMLIKKAKVIFSVNTGIAHLAASFNVKQICLHGPTNVKRWGPYSNKTISVVPEKGVFGYLNFGFEYHLAKGNCMDNISVDTVYNCYLQAMNKTSVNDE